MVRLPLPKSNKATHESNRFTEQLPLSNEHSDDVLEHPKKRRTKAPKESVLDAELHLPEAEKLNGKLYIRTFTFVSHLLVVDGVAKQDPSLPQTQLALDIYKNRARFPHCILLTRVGQFYEVGCSKLSANQKPNSLKVLF